MEFIFGYSPGAKDRKEGMSGKTSNAEDVKKFLDKLTQPKRSVLINFDPRTVDPHFQLTDADWISVDFSCFEDKKTSGTRIEMEIMPYDLDKNFATVDISTAKQIVGAMFKLSEIKSFRQELQKVPIKWIC